ncbi:hypothetical protein BJ138DRAFT_1008963 [Hygrophoropsis aurantiaca]|uniref:Uncharacterized protein n=1 Tax=Hygrophoropsis aurantiaca TaxID=72124 RepID=A0ACB8AAU5_9AGAM|nr:hypothetical protein BJ138DRAFT_1008963 [Hygrophoropsis aurantiaca]
MSILDTLPVDVLYVVAGLLTMDDIIRLRQVSRFFYDFTRDRVIWSKLYRNVKLPRVPGPYTRQSAESLENILITSAKVNRQWPPTKNPQVSTHLLPVDRADKHFSLVSGELLMVGSPSRVRCSNLRSTKADFAVIYEPPSGSEILFFTCVSTTTTDGEPLAFAICERKEPLSEQTTVDIFKVNVHASSPVTFDHVLEIANPSPGISAVVIGPRFLVISSSTREATNVPKHVWIMDVHNYRQYRLPFECPSSQYIVPHASSRIFISTSTHLLALHSFFSAGNGWRTLVEVFPIPAPISSFESTESPGESSILQLTHYKLMGDMELSGPVLLEERSTECSTKTTTFTLVGLGHDSYRSPRSWLALIHLTLSDGSPETISEQRIRLSPMPLSTNTLLLDAASAFDGCARGVYYHGRTHGFDGLAINLYNESNCAAIGPLNLEFDRRAYGRALVAFDGGRGRICHVMTIGDQKFAEVVDLA